MRSSATARCLGELDDQRPVGRRSCSAGAALEMASDCRLGDGGRDQAGVDANNAAIAGANSMP